MDFISIVELKEKLKETRRDLISNNGLLQTKNRLLLGITSAQNKIESEYNHRNKAILLKFLYKAKYLYLTKRKKEIYKCT